MLDKSQQVSSVTQEIALKANILEGSSQNCMQNFLLPSGSLFRGN
jgi:hypothetical protein